MIRKLYFLFLIIIPLSLLSCIDADEIVNNIDQHNAEENYTSPYMGKWVGTYSGDAINGTLILNVSKSGSIEVTRAENGSTGEVYYTGLQGSSGALNPAPSPKGFVFMEVCIPSPEHGIFSIGVAAGLFPRSRLI